MEQTIEEVLNRLVEVEDTALRMREALEDQKKELFFPHGRRKAEV